MLSLCLSGTRVEQIVTAAHRLVILNAQTYSLILIAHQNYISVTYFTGQIAH